MGGRICGMKRPKSSARAPGPLGNSDRVAPLAAKLTRPAIPEQAAQLRERLRGLTPAQAEMMRNVMRLHAQGDRLMAAQWLLQLAREVPAHPEVCLWQGLRHCEAGEWVAAVPFLERVAHARPGDFTPQAMCGVALGRANEADRAQPYLRQALALAREPGQWLKLSIECDELGDYALALRAVQGHLALQPQSTLGLLQRARVAKALGDSAQAAADARALIASGRELAKAWFTLVDLKTVALTPDERALLAKTVDEAALQEEDRILLDFAQGKALEDAGDYAGALTALQRVNGTVRRRTPWDTAGFAAYAQALREAFPVPDAGAVPPPEAGALDGGVPAEAAGQQSHQGREVIFLVGLPRSGSTLVEQVLAAHPQVEGASELPYLNAVLQAESARRGRAFPAWAHAATDDDWVRLGQDYLRASAVWRRQRPIATDKLPDNWQFVGAIRRMLPGARIIDCRRDALETCWSCYKQLFGLGLAAFSYDFDSLAQYWAVCEAEGERWAAAAPQAFRIQRYEALVAEPEAQIRELLAFCGLPFDPACLEFQRAERAIRTPSALQVRQPMKRTSTPAAGYGALLQPLQAALAAAAARPGPKEASGRPA
jgi:tetratricopeptide (TPR) repeat protein